MTTPNSSTKGSITSFLWKKFPLEMSNFSICLIREKGKRTKDFQNLYEYIKIVFPEKLIIHDSTQFYNPPKTKYTILKEYNNDKLDYLKDSTISNKSKCPEWLESFSLFQNYLQNTHVIVTGEFENIPSSVLTNSRLIIFESQDDSNKYLQTKHGAILNNFNITSNFIVVDKSIMGHFNIYELSKDDLIRYDKEFRFFL